MNRAPRQSRRKVLAAMVTTGIGGIAGCLGDDDDEPSSNQGPSTATENKSKDNTNGEMGTSERDPPQNEPCRLGDQSPWERNENPTGSPALTDDPNWRTVLHDAGNTGHNPQASGPDADPSVRWTAENNIAHLNHPQPLIVDGTVYVTGGSKLLAIDAENGEKRAVIDTDAKMVSRPTIVNERIFVSVANTIAAYHTSNGDQIWQTKSPLSEPDVIRTIDDTVYVVSGDSIFTFDAKTGEKLGWIRRELTLMDSEWKFPVIADGLVLPFRGNELLEVTGGRRTGMTELLYPILYSGKLYGNQLDPRRFYALDWESFECEWVYTPGQMPAGHFHGVSEERLLVALHGKYVGLDRSNGDVRWEVDQEELPFTLHTAGQIITDREMAYIGLYGGKIIALRLDDGTFKWHFDPETGGYPGHGISLADDLLVTVDQYGNVFALE